MYASKNVHDVPNCMSEQSASQLRLTLVLGVWLFAAAARQAFDVIGRLWIPVVFNAFQIISCALGLLAAFQRRAVLLAALSASTVISIVYNVLLAFWYEDAFGGDWRDGSDALAAGAPFSHSFFVRYTPLCDAATEFNATTGRWMQDPDNCYVAFYRAESIQAGIHAAIAFLTLVLSVTMLAQRRRGGVKSSEKPRRRGRTNGLAICSASPHIFGAGVAPNPSMYGGDASNDYTSMSSIQRHPTATDMLDKAGGAISTSSYDIASSEPQNISPRRKSENDHQSGVRAPNEIYGHEIYALMSRETDPPNIVKSIDIGRKNQLWNNSDDYSAAPTIEIDRCRPRTVAYTVSNSTLTADDDNSGVPEPPPTSPPQPRKLSTFADVNDLSPTPAVNQTQQDDESKTYSEIDAYDRSTANYELPLSRVALQSAGHDNAMPPIPPGGRLYASRNVGISGRQARLRKSGSTKLASNSQPTYPVGRQSAPYLVNESAQNVICSQILKPQQSLQLFHDNYPRQHNLLTANTSTSFSTERQNDHSTTTVGRDAFNEHDNFPPNTHTNLISFDPKSNTLIRVRKHQREPTDFDTPAENAKPRQFYFSSHHQRSNSLEQQAAYYQQYPPDNRISTSGERFPIGTIGNHMVQTLGNDRNLTNLAQNTVNDFANFFPKMSPISNGSRGVPLISAFSDSNNWRATDNGAYSVYLNDYCAGVDCAQPWTRFPIGGPMEAQITVASTIPLIHSDKVDEVNYGYTREAFDEADHKLAPNNVGNANEPNCHLNRYVHDEEKHITSFPKENGKAAQLDTVVPPFATCSLLKADCNHQAGAPYAPSVQSNDESTTWRLSHSIPRSVQEYV